MIVVARPTTCVRSGPTPADRIGIALDPGLPNAVGPVRADTHGYVTTYAQVAGKPTLHAARATAVKTLVILDEVHHAGDGLSWGDAVARAVRRRGPPALPDRYAVPHPGPTSASRSSGTDSFGRGGGAGQPRRLQPTATRRRWPTPWSGRSSSPPTRGRRAGGTPPARWSPPRCPRPAPSRRRCTAWRTALDPEGPVGAARHRRDGRPDHAPARDRHAGRRRADAGQRPGRRAARTPRSSAG